MATITIGNKKFSSPESTNALVDVIVKEDPATGQTSLNIPVPDKSTVINILSAFSAFLKK